MATTVGDLVVRLRADAKQFAATMTSVSKRMKTMGATMSSVGTRMTMGISAPLALIGIKASKAAMEFETNFAHIKGLVGATEETMNSFKDAIGEIGPVAGKTGGELSKAAFFITSAGLKGERAAAGVEALEAAAMGAAAGLGDTATVADAATSAMNAYGEANLSAKQAVAILVGTVREGKAEAASIAPVLGRLMPIAAELSVGFDQVGAAIAAMTRLGFDAATSATSLRATMVQILKPAKNQQEALAEIGLTFSDLRRQLREEGLISVLMTLKNTFGENEEAMARVFPNVRALSGVLALVGANAESTQQVFDSLAQTTTSTLDDAFAAVADTAQLKMNRAMAEMSGALRQLGEVILPTLIPWVQKFASIVKSLSDGFANLPEPLQSFIAGMGIFLTVAGPVLVLLGAIVGSVGSLIGGIGSLAGALAGPFASAMGGVASSGTALVGWLTTTNGLLAVTYAGVVGLGLAIGVLIGNAIRPWINETLGLNEALGLVADREMDLVNGLAENQEQYQNQLEVYNNLRRSLGLTEDKWRVQADWTDKNAVKLSQLTEEAIKLARAHEKSAPQVDLHTRAVQIHTNAQNQVQNAMVRANAEHKIFIDQLKETYDLQSKDDITKNLAQMVDEYTALKEAGIDQNQLADAFSQKLVDQVELAKQAGVELPKGIGLMAGEITEKADPALKGMLDKIATELPKHVNAMPGKIIPGMVMVGNEIATQLEGGFERGFTAGVGKGAMMEAALAGQVKSGVEKGVSEGEIILGQMRERQQAEVLTVRVVGDWSEFDDQAKYRSAGYTPPTGEAGAP